MTLSFLVNGDGASAFGPYAETWVHNLDTALRIKKIAITEGSSKLLRYSVTDVPEGVTVIKSYLMFKRSWFDPDSAALVVKTITTTPTSHGRIVPGSDSAHAVLEFQINAGELVSLINEEPYTIGVKSVLSDGKAYVHSKTVSRVHILKPLVEAIS